MINNLISNYVSLCNITKKCVNVKHDIINGDKINNLNKNYTKFILWGNL